MNKAILIRLLKILLGFIVTYFSSRMLLPLFNELNKPVTELSYTTLMPLFFLPFILIVASFYFAYRLNALEFALAGYCIPVINWVMGYLKQCSMVQTEGLLFPILLAPGLLIYGILKVIQSLRKAA